MLDLQPGSFPRGIHRGRCDNRGHLHLPRRVGAYLSSAGNGEVFLTALEDGVLRIYPSHIWEQNERLAIENVEVADQLADILFLAQVYGADARLDRGTSIPLATAIREKLGFDGQPVWIDCYRGLLNVSSREALERRRYEAARNLEDKLRLLRRAGFR
jgi:hypothetical protein